LRDAALPRLQKREDAMVKKPILTDDELDGGLPADRATPPPPPGSVTRPLDAPAAAQGGGSATRRVDAPEEMAEETMVPKSAETSGRDASGHARPKTRIHGYRGASRDEADASAMKSAPMVAPVVGWLVVTAGPGRGASAGLLAGMNPIGRGDENAVQLDYGDDTISREPHAFVTYDDETRMFHLSHGGKTNLVRLNDAPVLSSETLKTGDTIRIGATSLRFVALCGVDFDWSDA
jgi:hypothetical protein